MSLKPQPIQPIPKETVRIALAAFPKGNPYLMLRDELGTVFGDDDFAALFPDEGQPALPPWRLALVTLMQFRENLSDRQAAEAVRSRIDWKYLLGLRLSDPGFDFSVLSEFRARLITGEAEHLLLEKLLERCRNLGLVRARGKQRTDSTGVLASIRTLNRLELVAETLRAALNELATVAPDWVRQIAPSDWYKRYGRRIEDSRLPETSTQRDAYAQMVGEDGYYLLKCLEQPGAPACWRELSSIAALELTWQRHYNLITQADDITNQQQVRWKPKRELRNAGEGIESPYDMEARYRHRNNTCWTGYIVHLSETCSEEQCHLITHVMTTPATVYIDHAGNPYFRVTFPPQDCTVCAVRSNCTRAKPGVGRSLKLMPKTEYEALKSAREAHASPEGQQRYKRRAGIEGTISQGVRAFSLRRTRYRGLAKTHLQNIAIAAAMNIDRIFNWLTQVPRAKTRVSRFAALASV